MNRILKSKLFSIKYPPLAVFLTSDRISVVKLNKEKNENPKLAGFLIQTLDEGMIVSDHLGSNIANQTELSKLIHNLVQRLAPRSEEISVVVPDTFAKLAVLEVESLPRGREDIIEIVKWKMKSKLPLNVEDFMIDYTVMSRAEKESHLLVVLMKKSLIEQLEMVFNSIDLHPGLISVSTASLINLFSYMNRGVPEDSVHIYSDPGFFNITFIRNGTVSLYRSKDNRTAGRDLGRVLIKEIKASKVFYEEKMGYRPPDKCYGNLLTKDSTDLVNGLNEGLGTEIRKYDFRGTVKPLDRVVVEDDYIDILAPAVGAALEGCEQ